MAPALSHLKYIFSSNWDIIAELRNYNSVNVSEFSEKKRKTKGKIIALKY